MSGGRLSAVDGEAIVVCVFDKDFGTNEDHMGLVTVQSWRISML